MSDKMSDKEDIDFLLVKIKIIEWWSELIRIPKTEIDGSNNIFDYGGDSLCISQLLGRIEEEYSVEISVAELFEFPIINDFVRLICIKPVNQLHSPAAQEAV